ncbi:MAG: DUF4962 domain-containing protein [Armatimonadota bacterium]|jgi:hypothetical protein
MRSMLAVLALLAILATCHAQPVEIANPSFEIDEDGDGVADGWREAVHGDNFDLNLTDAVASEGARSMRITGLPDHGDRACVGQTTARHELPAAYRFSFDVRGEGRATALFRLRYNPPDGPDEDDRTWHFEVPEMVPDAWATKVIEIGVPDEIAAVGSARVEFYLYQRGEGDLFYDNVAIERLAEWTPPAEPAAPEATATVTLRNPGFETDEDADGLPDGWRTFPSGEGFEFGLTDDARSGERAAFITALPGHADRACWGQTVGPVLVAPGFRLTVWVKGEGRGTGTFRFRYTDAEGENAEETHYFTIDDISRDQWREKVFEFAPGRAVLDAATANIELLLYQRAEGTIYFDDVAIEPLTGAPRVQVSPAQQALQTPRRPVDRRVALQNPPDFTWPPEAAAERYELQIASDPDFATAETIADLRYNCYSHSAVLDPDARWWWRYRYVRGEQLSDWSEAWSFTIAPGAAEFPVPPPDELLARVPVEHPRVYATRETLEQFRAPSLAEKADWWERFRGRCEAHLAKDIPAEPGPEYDFSGRTGALAADDVARMNALRGLGSSASTPMWEMAFAYLVGGNERFGERAVEWLMEISDWDVAGTTGYRNHDQVFRDIAWKAACVYDWCHDLMTQEQRARALAMVEARGAILYHDFSEDARPIYEYPFDSHGWTSMGFLGIISAAIAHDSEQGDEWFQFIAATYPPLYPSWGGEEGGWCQGTAYWKWSVSYFAQFADAFRSASGVDLFDKAFTRNNGWFKIYMHPPYSKRHHFGDGNLGSPGTADRNNQLLFATRYDNPYFKWYADQIHGDEDSGVFGYWWYDYTLPARPPVDVPQSRFLADVGWVGMHSDISDPNNIMLIFKSSWWGSFNHSDADQNHFVIYGYGEPLLIDSGFYDWYGSDHDRHWKRQTKAHNAILVNGEGQPIFDITAKGQIVDYFESPVGCYTAGDATEAYKGKLSKFVRHILYLRPDAFVIVDELEAAEPATWTWAGHALQEMAVDGEARRVTITENDAALDIAFAAPAALSFAQHDHWDGHPPQGRYASQPQQWHLYAETTEPSEVERFVTLMHVREGGEPPAFDPGSTATGGVAARLGGLLAAVRDGDAPLTIGDLTVDARMAAAYRHEDGTCILAVECREIRSEAEAAPLFTSTEPVTVALESDEAAFVRADLRADPATEVAIRVPQGTDGLALNGEALNAEVASFAPQTGVVTLTLPAGMHSLTSPVARPVVEGRFELTIDGRSPAEIAQEILPGYTGGGLLFANFAAEPGLHRVAPSGAPPAPVTLNGTPLDAAGGLLWLRETNTLEARVTEPGTVPLGLERLALAPEPAVAEMLDSAPESALTIEAETFTESGLGNPSRYAHREFLSGGVGVGEWLVPGMWLRWRLEAPPGDYHLVIKGATHEAQADRLIMLDGEPVGGGWQLFRFGHTGGFGATPEEWAHMLVIGADGEPLTLSLDAPANALTMVCIENRLNLDYLMLVPAG